MHANDALHETSAVELNADVETSTDDSVPDANDAANTPGGLDEVQGSENTEAPAADTTAAGMADPSGAENSAAANTPGGLDEVQGSENTEAPAADTTAAGMADPSGAENSAAANTPGGLDEVQGSENTVDELEGQLAGLQEAMDQIQRGDLDGAEASIVALEASLASTGEEE